MYQNIVMPIIYVIQLFQIFSSTYYEHYCVPVEIHTVKPLYSGHLGTKKFGQIREVARTDRFIPIYGGL